MRQVHRSRLFASPAVRGLSLGKLTHENDPCQLGPKSLAEIAGLPQSSLERGNLREIRQPAHDWRVATFGTEKLRRLVG